MIVEHVSFDGYVLLDCEAGGPVGLLEENLGSGPEPRVSSSAKPSGDGSINRTRYWEPRIIELVGYCGRPEDPREVMTALLDEVRALFSLRESHVLRFTPLGGEERELIVVPASRFDAPVQGYAAVLQWAITLEAPDPRQYRVEVVEISYEPFAGSGTPTEGLAFPLDFLLSFSTPSEGAIGETFLSAYNLGTIETPVELTLAGPVTALSGIRNLTTGEEISFGLIGLAASDVLVIDTAARTVVKNGNPAPELIDAAGTSWFQLVPGENQIDVDGAGFLPGSTRLTARYREAIL